MGDLTLGAEGPDLALGRLDAPAGAYVDRAEAFGRRVRDEDGVATAVERLQRVLGR